MARPLVTALVLGALSLAACRDEQAGPRGRPMPGRPAAPRTNAAARSDATPPTDLTWRSEATFAGGAVRYHGTRVDPPNPQPGQRVTLTHYFEALQSPPSGWGFFVHVIDPATGAMLANADHDFQNGALPLETWPVGKVVADEHALAVPPSPGRVVLGFWREDQRLPVDQRNAHDGTMRALGPLIGGPAGANAGPGAGQSLPEYSVTRAAKPPSIDGELSDPAWQSAREVQLVGSFDGRAVSLRTTARLLYDDRFLYVAFDAEDPDVWGTLMKRDESIYEQEVVEIFLDADADGRTYNEMQVSPNNVTFDAYFPARRQGMDPSWDSQMQTAVKVRGTVNEASDRDEGWSAEMKIPFARLASVPNVPPRAGDRWRFNLYRLEHIGRTRVEGQAFSPLFVGDFHALPRFGWLVFE
jgi:hypothetical protein